MIFRYILSHFAAVVKLFALQTRLEPEGGQFSSQTNKNSLTAKVFTLFQILSALVQTFWLIYDVSLAVNDNAVSRYI